MPTKSSFEVNAEKTKPTPTDYFKISDAVIQKLNNATDKPKIIEMTN